LESFTGMKADHKLVIFGDMLELGDKSEEEHLKLLNELKSFNLTDILLVGQVFHKISLKSGIKSFSDTDKLMEFLKKEPVKGKTILIKGSRGIGLEKIYNLL
jgi:UDP-N-acetylmuramoyl-tripeptide--D-alanyl-D-alanine ligase